jgi:serine/threonine-protein kinase
MESQKLDAAVRAGDVIAGKYRVERLLGQGGMGMVVAARHLELDEQVAIKFLLPESLDSPEVVARFAREARSAVRIKNEHVARILDVGRLESGVPYIIMEYLDGVDLAVWLRQRITLSVEQGVDFILQACEAIAAAHALGIIHRDLKPANLFVVKLGDGSRSIKVLDFGISKLTAQEDSLRAITHTSAVLGSPLYMPPEQMRSARNADTRSDIWALGVILYELLAGSPPFGGESMTEVLTQVLEVEPENLSLRAPQVPPELAAVVQQCLQKDRALRYASIAELARALAPFAPARGHLSAERIARVLTGSGLDAADAHAPARTPAPESGPVAGTRASWGGTQFAAQRSRRHVLVLGGATAVAVVAVAAFWVWGRREPAVVGPTTSIATGSDGSVSPGVAVPSKPVAPVPTLIVAPAPPEPEASAKQAEAPASTLRSSPGKGAARDRADKNAKPAPARGVAAAQATTPSPPAPPAPKTPNAQDPFEDR